MRLPWSIEPSSSSREGGGSRGGGDRGRRGGEGSNPGGGGLLGFPPSGEGGDFRIGATWTDGVKVTGDKLGDVGVAPIGEIGGLPGLWVGLGKGFGVSVTDVVHGVHPWEVGIESGAVTGGRSRGGVFVCRPRGGGDRGQGCLGTLGGGQCLSDVTGHELTR